MRYSKNPCDVPLKEEVYKGRKLKPKSWQATQVFLPEQSHGKRNLVITNHESQKSDSKKTTYFFALKAQMVDLACQKLQAGDLLMPWEASLFILLILLADL